MAALKEHEKAVADEKIETDSVPIVLEFMPLKERSKSLSIEEEVLTLNSFTDKNLRKLCKA